MCSIPNIFPAVNQTSLSTDETMLVVQQEFRNTSAMYGHMPLLGITKLVEPFFTGEPNSAHWEDYPPNYTIARAAKEQGGAVCYTHPAKAPEIPVGPTPRARISP